MQLADEQIKKFQLLYKKHYGIEIDEAEALDKGIRLIRLTEIISKHEAKKLASAKQLPINNN